MCNRLRLAVVLFLTFIIPYVADAQVPVDILIDMNGNPVGTQASPNVMAAGTKGTGIDWQINDSVQAMKVGPGRFSLPGPIRIGSTVYSESHPHQSLQYDTAYSFNTFRGFLSGNQRALTTAGYLTLGIPDQGDSGGLSDLVRIHLGQGAGSIMQLYNGNGPGYVLNIEAYGGNTSHSAKIPVQPGNTYWYSFKADYVAGRAFLNVYDLPNFDLIGSVTQNTQTGTIAYVQYGNGQGADAGSPGQNFNYFELSLIDWTNAAFPLLPEGSGSGQSTGIASRYPNDEGIGDDPAVIYATGFDSPDWLTTDLPAGTRLSYIGGSDLTDRPTWTGTEAFTGSGSLQYLLLAGTNNPNIMEIIGFAPVDEVYMRWYRKYDPNFRWGFQSAKNNGVYAQNPVDGLEACVQPNGFDKYSFRVQDQRRSSTSGDFYGALYAYHPDADNGGCGEWYSQNQGGIKYQQPGRWYSYEIYLKANTVGMSDGVIRMWIDGELRGEITGLQFRLTDTLKINKVSMYGSSGGYITPDTQYIWDDNLVLAREYIGPMVTTAPPLDSQPNPPTNLSILVE